MRSHFIRSIALLLCFTALHAHAGKLDEWKRYSSEHMVLYTDYKDEQARAFLDDFEVFRSVVINLQKGDISKKLPVVRAYLFKSESLFDDFVENRNIGGFFRQTRYGPYMVIGPSEKEDGTRQTLFHEYVHYLMHSVIPIRYAPWYNEGIAELFSTMIIREDFVYVGRAPESAAYSLSKIGFLKMDDLFNETKVWSKSNRYAAKFYGSAWLTTHFVTLGARNGFPSYYRNTATFLQLQNQGVSAEEAFDLSFDISMSDFTKALKKYSRINNREGVSFPKPTLNTNYKVEALSESKMTSEIAKIKGINPDDEMSYEYYQKALKANEPYAIAYSALANAETKQFEMALNQLKQLSELNSKGIELESDTLYLMGLAYDEMSKQATSDSSAGILQGRASEFKESALAVYVKSNDKGRYIPTLVGAARYYESIGDKQTAMDMVEKFTQYSPSNLWALKQAALIAMTFNEYQIAQKHLQSILNSIHPGENVFGVKELLALIEQQQKLQG